MQFPHHVHIGAHDGPRRGEDDILHALFVDEQLEAHQRSAVAPGSRHDVVDRQLVVQVGAEAVRAYVAQHAVSLLQHGLRGARAAADIAFVLLVQQHGPGDGAVGVLLVQHVHVFLGVMLEDGPLERDIQRAAGIGAASLVYVDGLAFVAQRLVAVVGLAPGDGMLARHGHLQAYIIGVAVIYIRTRETGLGAQFVPGHVGHFLYAAHARQRVVLFLEAGELDPQLHEPLHYAEVPLQELLQVRHLLGVVGVEYEFEQELFAGEARMAEGKLHREVFVYLFEQQLVEQLRGDVFAGYFGHALDHQRGGLRSRVLKAEGAERDLQRGHGQPRAFHPEPVQPQAQAQAVRVEPPQAYGRL